MALPRLRWCPTFSTHDGDAGSRGDAVGSHTVKSRWLGGPGRAAPVAVVAFGLCIFHATSTALADKIPPEVTVTFPIGGEVFTSSLEQTITWIATDNSGSVVSVAVFVSFDGGVQWDPLARLIPNWQILPWFVHNRPTTAALIRVDAEDPFGNVGSGISPAFFEIVSAPGGRVPTTLRDFDMPGTQPNTGDPLNTPSSCAGCHGNYNRAVEPYFNWQGSMMAYASIDPLFLAALDVANRDAPESGDLCLRCHMSAGWLEGRSIPTDASRILAEEKTGISCDLCHRLVDPFYDKDQNPVEDVAILNNLRAIPSFFTTGQYIVDPASWRRRGPFEVPIAGHDVLVSPFHREAALCGTCHNVSNPVFTRNANGEYELNPLDKAAASFGHHEIGPVERTYSEWFFSDFNTQQGVFAPEFGGNLDYVATCQDCHQRDVTGKGCIFPESPIREDLPLHDFTGGSAWLVGIMNQVDPTLNRAALRDGALRARYMLQNAAQLDIQQNGAQLDVTVTNKSGHKLPTGYPEGRRIWVNVRFFNGRNTLIKETGAYDPVNAELIDDPEIKVYEAIPVIGENIAALVGLPANTVFHFVLNNKFLKDNRIPPLGFTNDDYDWFGGAPVGATYADGQNWDTTVYAVPFAADRVEVTLFYQSTTKEYVEFLRDNGTPGGAGQFMYDLWANNGMCPPEMMLTRSLNLSPQAQPNSRPDGEFKSPNSIRRIAP